MKKLNYAQQVSKLYPVQSELYPAIQTVKPIYQQTRTFSTLYFYQTQIACGFIAGLSLRGGGQGFPPVTNVDPSYFHRKIEEK